MASYLLTGGTGFLGRHLLARLVQRPGAVVHVLVRPSSLSRLERLTAGLEGGERAVPLLGDIRQELLGLSEPALDALAGADHVVHLAALYDMTATAADNEDLNVGGTRRALDVAARIGAGVFHHVSSIAVAGEHRGSYTETMFDEGQELPSPYHATKFEAERLVREQSAVPWRVYRPSIVVGDSRTGQMDKVDGPYYFLPLLASIGGLPGMRHVPLVLPDLGDSNVVPVDYVADAMDALVHADGLDGQAFHLAHPRPQPLLHVYNALARAAGAPQVAVGLTRRLLPAATVTLGLAGRLPGVTRAAEVTAGRLGIPPSVLAHSTFRPVFATDRTRMVLHELGIAPPPELPAYAQTLYDYWAAHLDPLRARRRRNGSPLNGRTVVVTGASSGIGRAAALKIAERGGIPLLLARRTEELEKVQAEIVAAGGRASYYSVDLTSTESIDACVQQMLAEHDGIDMLVNNAGRSIRRSIRLSYDRFHDYERTMALNYFAPVRLVLALLPHMANRRFGHIVNISSIGVQTNVPRFSAYVASKAALDAFSRVAATEVVGDGITFTTIHMPLVRTPMIAPTSMYDRFPTLSPDQAADMIIGALERQPKHVGTRLGTSAVVATALAPKVVDAVLHTAYLLFPDSTAAGGDASQRTETPEALSRGALVLSRLLPGVHW
ncbi:MAG: short-chain dehydrogenase [Frankiales bacterium]|nr:short-chain dehydrogenase [Frankiales bacterium]